MRKGLIILILILGLAFVLRLYRIDNPVADWHSWRQADTASVTREFSEKGVDLLFPKYHDLSNVPSGLDNPQGLRFVEFPIYNLVSLAFFRAYSDLSIETWGRLATVVSSVFSAFFIYSIVKRYAGEIPGLLSAFYFAVLPFSVYFGRVIIPDPMMTASFLGAIYFFILWSESTKKKSRFFPRLLFFLISLFFASLSLLLKPFAAFFLLPLIAISYQAFGLNMFKKIELYTYALVAILPLIFWRIWMMQFPEGVPASSWLFNEGGILTSGAYFYWIFAERIGKLIYGYLLFGIALLGLVALMQKSWLENFRTSKTLIFGSFLLSSILYLLVIARGNVQHDYYQIPIIPSLVMVLGIGAGFLVAPGEKYNKLLTRITLVVVTVLSLSFSWYHVRDFFNINNPNIIVAGQAVDRLVPKDAKVIALYGGDTSFLYQTKRKGWASLQDPLPIMRLKGAEYMVIVNPTDADRQGFGTEYENVSSEEEYLLLKLSD